MSRGKRKKMIMRESFDLSLGRQCVLVSISRSSFYYRPKGTSKSNLTLMEQIDKGGTKNRTIRYNKAAQIYKTILQSERSFVTSASIMNFQNISISEVFPKPEAQIQLSLEK